MKLLTSKQIITSQKKNTNFYQNISNLPEHQSSMDYLKYINSLKNFHHSDQCLLQKTGNAQK